MEPLLRTLFTHYCKILLDISKLVSSSSGFDTDSVLNVFGAILQLFRVSLTYEYETVIDVTTGDDSQRLSAIGLPIGPSDQTLFWIKAMSNLNDVNSFTLAIQTNDASIGGDAFGVMIDIRVNIRGDLSVDLDDSSIISQVNLKAIFENITSTNQSTKAQDLLDVFSIQSLNCKWECLLASSIQPSVLILMLPTKRHLQF